MARVLATILAHPDDETFGVGGTLIRAVDEGIEVHSLCLTRGEKGWNGGGGAPVIPREQVGQTRAAELGEAAKRMGLSSATCLSYPDADLARAPADEVVRDIVRWLRHVRPDVVITWGPDGGYGHPDHIAAGERALRAIELAGIQRHEPGLGEHVHVKRAYRFVATAELVDNLERLVPEFAAYVRTLEVKPQRWTPDRLGACVDVSAFIDRKIHAMRAHRTQTPDINMWMAARELMPSLMTEEAYVREFPDPHGPLETDLFAALREPASVSR